MDSVFCMGVGEFFPTKSCRVILDPSNSFLRYPEKKQLSDRYNKR